MLLGEVVDEKELEQLDMTEEAEPVDDIALFMQGKETPAPEGEAQPEPAAEPQLDAAKLKEELENLKAALREEREGHKVSKKTLDAIVTRFEQAQAQAQQQGTERQAVQDMAELPDEDRWFLEKSAKFLSPYLQEFNALKQQQQQAQQIQTATNAWGMEADRYGKENPDFGHAMLHLGQKFRKRAEFVYPDNPQAQHEYILLQAQSAQAYPPDKLYKYITEFEGYVPGQGGQQPQAQPQPAPGLRAVPPQQPKSLSMVPGSSPSGQQSLQARAERILSASNLKDIMKITEDDLEEVLKRT